VRFPHCMPESVNEEDNEQRQQSQDFPDRIGEINNEGSLDNATLLKDLQSRQDELKQGIGKRFKVKTQNGFLNVHSDTSSPFAIENICGKLAEGEIVTSTGPNVGDWVNHDGCGGGWSISKFGGWQWLIEQKD
jgi:hypothetical protein